MNTQAAYRSHGETALAGFSNERIRIRMEAYDHEVLDRTAHEIVDTAQRTGAVVHGPIPLPTRIERYTVLRSPHIDRKSREQFEIRTHKRLIDILQPTGKTIEALNKGLSLPPGVDIKIRVVPGLEPAEPRLPLTERIRRPPLDGPARPHRLSVPTVVGDSASEAQALQPLGLKPSGRACVVATTTRRQPAADR